MSWTFAIEVAVPNDISTTARGKILETFAKELLETQNFRVTEQLRITGMEVDLLAVDKATGERILVECKAHRSNISSESISKLYGNVGLRKFSAGWLITTSPLSKEGKGVMDEWEAGPSEVRRKLQVYTPDNLIKRLISAKIIVSPDKLVVLEGLRLTNEAYLLLTPVGRFWVIVVADRESGIRNSVIAYEAQNGEAVRSRQTLDTLSLTDSTLAALEWLAASERPHDTAAAQLKSELQNIVRVPAADRWADYRPARPQDFIGRDQFQKEVFEFFDRVRNGKSQTRILAIKGPSGWGKSSCVLKIAASAASKGNKRRAYIFSVDSRAATSRRFGELALHAAMQDAVASGFVKISGDIAVGGPDNPFSTDAMKKISAALIKEKKIICVIFDQFEELLSKQELETVFDEIRVLCNSIDEAQANIVIGFSWKTDGTIPTEHNAYHLWHTLSDRRLEFELRPFNNSEVIAALNRFAKELKQPLVPQLKRLLQEHSQGYPWLLKKLCIHVLELLNNGSDQFDVLERALSIGELFSRDLQRLNEKELACIRKIATEAPEEFFKIVNIFGDDIVNKLIDKRLVVRSGTRLNIYWDIFRDYVLTQKVPYIPVTYVPTANYALYVNGLKFLNLQQETTYDAIQSELNIAEGTADNLVRDFVMVGHAEANRRKRVVRASYLDNASAVEALINFWKSHVAYLGLIRELPPNRIFPEALLKVVVIESYSTFDISEKLADNYTQRILRWLTGVGLLQRLSSDLFTMSQLSAEELLDSGRVAMWKRGTTTFLGEAPPEKVVAALRYIAEEKGTRENVETKYGRNTFYALMNLGLVDPLGRISIDLYTDGAEETVRKTTLEKSEISFVLNQLGSSPKITGEELGSLLSDHLEVKWSVGSQKRNGGALKKWATWATRHPSYQKELFES